MIPLRTPGSDSAAEAAAAVRAMMPAWVAVEAGDPLAPAADLPPAEAAAVAGAVERRRREFAAGRVAARRAMAALGLEPEPIPAAADRAPLWPAGVVGSISHSRQVCVAVIARAGSCRSLAIDLEPDGALSADLLPTVCTAAERAWLAARPDGPALATVIFSAKECAYKARYPLSGQLIDFQEVEISLDTGSGTFTADFGEAGDLGPADRVFTGQWRQAAGHVVTAIVVPPVPAALPRIELPYLLVCPIEYHEGTGGDVWIDRLWHRDLLAHLDYLGDLRVAAPRRELAGTEGLVRVEPPAGARLEFVPLPAAGSLGAALRTAPALFLRLLAAVRAARIVHCGAAGWPIPYGALANPLALLLRKRLVVVIESAFWRVPPGTTPRPQVRVRAWFTERLARWSVRHAGLAVLTSEAYRQTLAAGASGEVLVAPATWISDSDILTEALAGRAWAAKAAAPRLVFAGRLNAEKGVAVLLEALRLLDRRGERVEVDILGDGPMRADCLRAAAELRCVRLAVHDPVAYGPDFFGFLRERHAALVPSITDEQPRILYDAFSQAVPVIASATGGHSDCLRPGRNGLLVAPGDPDALASALAAAAADPKALQRMGLAALQDARARTHQAMHRTRAEALRRLAGA